MRSSRCRSTARWRWRLSGCRGAGCCHRTRNKPNGCSRVSRRYAPRLQHGDKTWRRQLYDALDEFPRQLPADLLMLEAVLALFEIELIRAHSEGWEVGEIMRALDGSDPGTDAPRAALSQLVGDLRSPRHRRRLRYASRRRAVPPTASHLARRADPSSAPSAPPVTPVREPTRADPRRVRRQPRHGSLRVDVVVISTAVGDPITRADTAATAASPA